MNIEPEGVMLLVKPDEVSGQEGRILIPIETQNRRALAMTTGIITLLGPAVKIEFNAGPAKEGDRILYAKYAGHVLKDREDNDREHRLIDHKDVLARVG